LLHEDFFCGISNTQVKNSQSHNRTAWDARDVVASPTLKYWPLFAQKFSQFWQINYTATFTFKWGSILGKKECDFCLWWQKRHCL